MQEKQSLFHRNTVLGMFLHFFFDAFKCRIELNSNIRIIVEQKTELYDDMAKDKVLTEAELTASVDVVLLKGRDKRILIDIV